MGGKRARTTSESRPVVGKRMRPSESEVLDGNESDDDCPAPSPVVKVIQPDKIGFYSGLTKDILVKAKMYIRLHLVTEDLFPPADKQLELVEDAFYDSCEAILDRKARVKGAVYFLAAPTRG